MSLFIPRVSQFFGCIARSPIKNFATKSFSTSLPRYVEPPISYKYAYAVGGLVLAGSAGYYMYNLNTNVTSSAPPNDIRASNRIKATYGYVLGGIAATAVTAVALFKTSLPAQMVKMGPLLCFGVSMVTTIPTLFMLMSTDYEKSYATKHALWLGFNGLIAANLCGLGFVGGPLIAQAALATGCIVGGLSLMAVNTKPESLENFEAPLGIGLGVIVGAGLGSLLFPMPFLHTISLYGGLAVFSGLTMTDTNKLIKHAKTSEDFDPINESLGIYLDTINIFIRVLEITYKLKNKFVDDKKD